MGGEILLYQMLTVHMGVDLGGGYVRMAQYLLDHPQVGTTIQHMGGERMTEGVRMQPFDPDGLTCRPYYLVEPLTRDATSPLVQEDRSQAIGIRSGSSQGHLRPSIA